MTQVQSATPTAASVPHTNGKETPEQEIARLRAENAALQARVSVTGEHPMFVIKTQRIGKDGVAITLDEPLIAVSIGNSFPVSHGARKWLVLAEAMPKLVEFINANKAALKLK